MTQFAYPQIPSFPSPDRNMQAPFDPANFQFTGQAGSEQSLDNLFGANGMTSEQLQNQLFESLQAPPQPVAPNQVPSQWQSVKPEDLGYHWNPLTGSFQREQGGTRFTQSPEQMDITLQKEMQRRGILPEAGQEMLKALLQDLENTTRSEQFRTGNANMLAALGLTTAQEGAQAILGQAKESAGRLGEEAGRLSALGQSGVEQTQQFIQQRLGEVRGLIDRSLAEAEKALTTYQKQIDDFSDISARRQADLSISIYRRAAPQMAQLTAIAKVNPGSPEAAMAAQQIQQLAIDTQIQADQVTSGLEYNRREILAQQRQVQASLGTALSQAAGAGAQTMAGLSAAMGGQLQQALGNQLQFEQLSTANTQLAENLLAAAQTNALQYQLLGMQFAAQTFQAPHYPSIFEALLGFAAVPYEQKSGPATGLYNAYQGTFT